MGWPSCWRSRTGIPTHYAHYTPVLDGVKRRKDKGLSSGESSGDTESSGSESSGETILRTSNKMGGTGGSHNLGPTGGYWDRLLGRNRMELPPPARYTTIVEFRWTDFGKAGKWYCVPRFPYCGLNCSQISYRSVRCWPSLMVVTHSTLLGGSDTTSPAPRSTFVSVSVGVG